MQLSVSLTQTLQVQGIAQSVKEFQTPVEKAASSNVSNEMRSFYSQERNNNHCQVILAANTSDISSIQILMNDARGPNNDSIHDDWKVDPFTRFDRGILASVADFQSFPDATQTASTSKDMRARLHSSSFDPDQTASKPKGIRNFPFSNFVQSSKATAAFYNISSDQTPKSILEKKANELPISLSIQRRIAQKQALKNETLNEMRAQQRKQNWESVENLACICAITSIGGSIAGAGFGALFGLCCAKVCGATGSAAACGHGAIWEGAWILGAFECLGMNCVACDAGFFERATNFNFGEPSAQMIDRT